MEFNSNYFWSDSTWQVFGTENPGPKDNPNMSGFVANAESITKVKYNYYQTDWLFMKLFFWLVDFNFSPPFFSHSH